MLKYKSAICKHVATLQNTEVKTSVFPEENETEMLHKVCWYCVLKPSVAVFGSLNPILTDEISEKDM